MQAKPTGDLPRFHLVVREARDGTPFYEVKWRSRIDAGRQLKRRIGPAWLDRSADGEWRKRAGRARGGAYDERTGTVRAAEVVGEVEASLTVEARQAAADAARPLTFRAVAHEWIADLEGAGGAKPATIANYRTYLREPGAAYKRGGGASAGRLMRAFGDRDVREVTPRDVGLFLRELDAEGMSARSVNAYRQVASCVFAYACREDTHGLPANPVAKVPKRREPAPAELDFYEVTEVEKLAQALADGRHRKSAAGDLSTDELLARAEEDARDASLVRTLLYTGLRVGEALALRWRDVDLDAGVIVVRRNLSAGEVVDTPKGGRMRTVAMPSAAIHELRTLHGRPAFTSPDDYVFCGRLGDELDDSALRKRYKAAAKASGLREVKLHGLRHANGSLLARHAAPSQVRDQLGHAKQATTDRYVHARVTDALREQLDAAFPPPTSSEGNAGTD